MSENEKPKKSLATGVIANMLRRDGYSSEHGSGNPPCSRASCRTLQSGSPTHFTSWRSRRSKACEQLAFI
jgi:hypothetical protein